MDNQIEKAKYRVKSEMEVLQKYQRNSLYILGEVSGLRLALYQLDGFGEKKSPSLSRLSIDSLIERLTEVNEIIADDPDKINYRAAVIEAHRITSELYRKIKKR